MHPVHHAHFRADVLGTGPVALRGSMASVEVELVGVPLKQPRHAALHTAEAIEPRVSLRAGLDGSGIDCERLAAANSIPG